MMIKGEKSKIPSLQHHLFLTGECHRNENKHLTKIQNWKCLQLFFPFGSIGTPRTICYVIIRILHVFSHSKSPWTFYLALRYPT